MMKKIACLIDSIEKYLLVCPFLLLGLCIVFEVFSRKFFHFGLSWLQELGRYIMVYGTFLGASIAVKGHNHPSMTAIKDSVPLRLKQAMGILSNLICCVGMGVVAYYSWIQLRNYIRIGTLTSSLWGMPVFVPFAIMPICSTVMCVRFLMEIYLEPRTVGRKAAEKKEAEAS